MVLILVQIVHIKSDNKMMMPLIITCFRICGSHTHTPLTHVSSLQYFLSTVSIYGLKAKNQTK